MSVTQIFTCFVCGWLIMLVVFLRELATVILNSQKGGDLLSKGKKPPKKC